MDIRTGRIYETREAARADGVPDADIALIEEAPDGPRPRFAPPKPQWKFSKGSFKPVGHAVRK